MAYTVDEILDSVETNFGSARRNEIEARIDSGCLGVGELVAPKENGGASDHNTMLIASWKAYGKKNSLLFAGVTMNHEFTHVMNAVNAGTTNDPTNDGPCGPCVEASMNLSDAGNFLDDCEYYSDTTDPSKDDVCDLLETVLQGASDAADACAEAVEGGATECATQSAQVNTSLAAKQAEATACCGE